MRKLLIIGILILASLPASSASISKATRDDWRSLDASVRHLEREGETAIPKVLEHIKPMRDRRATIFLKRIRLGGQDEEKLVGRQWTRAGEAKDRGAIAKTIVGSVLRYIWNFALDIVDAVLPGCAFLLPVVIAMYLYIRYGRKVIRAMCADAEKNMGPGERKKVFTSEISKRDYAKQKKKGKL